MAQLGRQIFYDTSLSSSGKLSCASCHSPDHAYGPPNDGPVMLGGPTLSRQGARAVPSLTYLERQPDFSIGPDERRTRTSIPGADGRGRPRPQRVQRRPRRRPRRAPPISCRRAACSGTAAPIRCRIQATGPLLDPREMDGGSIEKVADKLRHAPYAGEICGLFGESIFKNTKLLVAEAMFAVARYQLEEPSFHPYTSKFDYWLEGKALLSARAKCAAYQLFNDPEKANCGGCHTVEPNSRGFAAALHRPPV